MKQKNAMGGYMSALMLLLCGLSLIGCAAMPWQTSSDVPELVVDGIYRGPRPNFDEMKKISIGTIISLEDNAEVVNVEKAIAYKMNIAFMNCPLSETTPPTPDALRNVVREIDKHRKGRVYVHCRRGIDRTGYGIASFRILNEGWTFDRAYEEVLAHGHSELYYASWKPSLRALCK